MTLATLYVDNATAMWASINQSEEVSPGVLRITSSRGTRLLLRAAMSNAEAAELLAEPASGPMLTLEDSFGTTSGPPAKDVTVLHMPVMVRQAAASIASTPGSARRVRTSSELAIAEDVIAAGFPLPSCGRGELLPPETLAMPAWQVWLAYHDGSPAAAACTYDDGNAVGVYLLATLPEYRSKGLGRSLMSGVIAANPHRDLVLTATDAGAPLYESLGFVAISNAVWHFRKLS